MEPILLGIVVGLVIISVLGLFIAATVFAAFHSARLGMIIAVIGFNFMIEVPTRVLAEQPVTSGDATIASPIDATGKVGCRVSAADSDVFVPFSAEAAHTYVFGPVPAPVTTTVLSRALAAKAIYPAVDVLDSTSTMLQPWVVGLEHYACAQRVLAPDALSLSYPIVVAGNRGRGQLYPDGTPSNNAGFRSGCTGLAGRVHLGWRSSQLGTRVSIDTIYVQIVVAIAITQLALGLNLSYPIVVAGNRGRVSARSGCTGRVHLSRDGLSLACWTFYVTSVLNIWGVTRLARAFFPATDYATRLSVHEMLRTVTLGLGKSPQGLMRPPN